MVRFVIACCASAAIAVLASGAGWSQARAIRVVVPYGPGGAPDVLARLLAEEIGKAHGVTMVVENRAGAGAIIGTESVARAVPDGNTLLIAANAMIANPHLRKVSYDALTSFEPICHLVSVPAVIVVNAASPYKTLGDLLKAARAEPGKVTLASPGPATTFHIALEMLKRAANVNITYVPYPTTPPALTALIGDHVSSVFSDYASISGSLKAGNVRAIATTGASRAAILPDVPTVAESGYKDFELDVWFGIVAPAKTPKDTVAELIGWYSAALRADTVKQKLAAQALNPVARCGVEFAASLRRQYDDMGRIIRETGIKAE
jgi:tripartite-type tricarboxylate transporter receptor subunit TctC